MIKLCLENNLITRNKAAINNIIATKTVSNKLSELDISELRILSCGLLQVMNTIEYNPTNNQFNHQNTNNLSKKLTSEGKLRKIRGKHVILSMGSKGILWTGLTSMFGNEADIIIDDEMACKHVPARILLQNDIKHTNGAGDAFCAGFLSELLNNHNDPTIVGPTIKCIENGLDYAYLHIQNSSK